MQRDGRSFLWDVATAVTHIRTFVNGKTLADYQVDVMLSCAPRPTQGLSEGAVKG
jgi:uncharacterized protein with HEPN domain